MKNEHASLDHLSWLVNFRSQNQSQCHRLLVLLDANRDQLEVQDSDQGVLHFLISVVFSLWRAVFLGETDEKQLLEHARGFLANLIEHNSVSYQSDQKTKSYTFSYYITVAAQSLSALHEYRGDIVPKKVDTQGKDPKGEWEYLYELTTEAIDNFQIRLDARRSSN